MSEQPGAIDLTVIVPTFNERGNVGPLLERISGALEGERWEAIFVDDDSPDGTHQRVRELAGTRGNVRLIHRIGRRGLSSACLEGMLASTSPYVAVIDADLQHDERLLADMLKTIREGDLDLVVASRHTGQGGFGTMPPLRIAISRFATWLATRVLKLPLSDPMSGFFMTTRELIDGVSGNLYGQGFKILLDICANAGRELRIAELPYTMRARQSGESKLDLRVVLEYLLFLANKIIGWAVPLRFVKFCMIGGTGVIVHLGVLGLVHRVYGAAFIVGQVAGALTAMTSNYALNNLFTFSQVRRTGRRFWTGLVSFYIICSIGAVIGISVGEVLHRIDVTWWGAGLVTTLVAAIWNYSVSSAFTWRAAGQGPR